MSGEFDLIRRHAPSGAHRLDVILGSGDDAALLRPEAGKAIVATTDTLVAGRHFPEQTCAFDIGWKSLAVNLSDLAAMGAEAAWATVALSMPSDIEDPDAWMADFAAGIQALAEQSGVAIVGGDLTAGSLSVTIQALGQIDAEKALRRDGAQPGDVIAVTGTLGDAALALALLQSGQTVPAVLLERLNRPQPRLEAGQALSGVAHAAIDLSDGLAADLEHILDASGVAASIHINQLPQSETFKACCPETGRIGFLLSGGDDYELCICLPPEALDRMDLPLTVIGEVTVGQGLSVFDEAGESVRLVRAGYDHFNPPAEDCE